MKHVSLERSMNIPSGETSFPNDQKHETPPHTLRNMFKTSFVVYARLERRAALAVHFEGRLVGSKTRPTQNEPYTLHTHDSPISVYTVWRCNLAKK